MNRALREGLAENTKSLRRSDATAAAAAATGEAPALVSLLFSNANAFTTVFGPRPLPVTSRGGPAAAGTVLQVHAHQNLLLVTVVGAVICLMWLLILPNHDPDQELRIGPTRNTSSEQLSGQTTSTIMSDVNRAPPSPTQLSPGR